MRKQDLFIVYISADLNPFSALEESFSSSHNVTLEKIIIQEDTALVHLMPTLKEILSREIRKQVLVFFRGHCVLSSKHRGGATAKESISFSTHRPLQTRTKDEITLTQLESLILEGPNSGTQVILDCAFPENFIERNGIYLRQAFSGLKISARLVRTFERVGHRQIEVLAASDVTPSSIRENTKQYIKTISFGMNNEQSLDDIGFLILEGLSLNNLAHKDSIFQYYELSMQESLSERDADLIGTISALAEHNKNLSEMLSRVDKLVCQKLDIEDSSETCETQIDRAIVSIELGYTAAQLRAKTPTREDSLVSEGVAESELAYLAEVDLWSFLLGGKITSSHELCFDAQGKLDPIELMRAEFSKAWPKGSSLLGLDLLERRQHIYAIAASDYYRLSLKSALSESDSLRFDEIFDLIESDPDFAVIVEKVDELLSQKLTTSHSRDDCDAQLDKARSLIEKGEGVGFDDSQSIVPTLDMSAVEKFRVLVCLEYSKAYHRQLDAFGRSYGDLLRESLRRWEPIFKAYRKIDSSLTIYDAQQRVEPLEIKQLDDIDPIDVEPQPKDLDPGQMFKRLRPISSGSQRDSYNHAQLADTMNTLQQQIQSLTAQLEQSKQNAKEEKDIGVYQGQQKNHSPSAKPQFYPRAKQVPRSHPSFKEQDHGPAFRNTTYVVPNRTRPMFGDWLTGNIPVSILMALFAIGLSASIVFATPSISDWEAIIQGTIVAIRWLFLFVVLGSIVTFMIELIYQ